MINNDMSNPLERFFSNHAGDTNRPADLYERIKERRDAIGGKKADEFEVAQKDAADKTAANAKPEDAKLSPEERRRKEVQAILAQMNAEEAKDKPVEKKGQASNVDASGKRIADVDGYGFPAFLNDLPLFNQFKTDLVNAFRSLDGATAGSISAQFELNYRSVEMIANEMGGYEIREATYNFKLDLNYVKAAAGADKNASMSELFGADKKDPTTPSSLLDNLKEYFSPRNTADRIVDFASSFFPMSEQFKANGDTEGARSEFAETMREAIQKGFDQAMGKLGKVPGSVRDGIDETHRLTFQGIDDFVKYGMNRGKDGKTDDFFNVLQQFSMSMSQSYSQTTYTYTPGASGRAAETTPAKPAEEQAKAKSIDAKA
ncbi:MAG: DUF5610 domain-containing protein [Planctomycetota bacterium]|nr:DUF5610 domain-containing protein [Planctomycetota bacterium]